ITLIEFPVAALLWLIRSPNRLDLVAFEWKCKLAIIHGDEPGKGDGEVILQRPFSYTLDIFSGKQLFEIVPGLLLFIRVIQAVIQYFKNEFITFFSVLTH